jgi:hypothetical protein
MSTALPATTRNALAGMPPTDLAELLDGSRLVVLAVTANGQVAAVNESFMRLTGRRPWPADTPLGALFDGVPGDAAQFLAEVDKRRASRLLFRDNVIPGGAVSLLCQVLPTADGWLVCGEHPLLDDAAVLDRISALNNELTNLSRELRRRNQELETAQSQIKTLRGLLPICCHCKKIRNDEGYWQQMEMYIREHSDAEFSHCICESCMRELYPEYAKRIPALATKANGPVGGQRDVPPADFGDGRTSVP